MNAKMVNKMAAFFLFAFVDTNCHFSILFIHISYIYSYNVFSLSIFCPSSNIGFVGCMQTKIGPKMSTFNCLYALVET